MVRSVQNGHQPFSFRWCLLCIVLAFSQISSVVYAQGGVESSEFLEKQRIQKRLWIGPTFNRGSFELSANEVSVIGRLDGMLGLQSGGEFWDSERFGIYGNIFLGFGQDLQLPQEYNNQLLNLNQSLLNLGARVRWYFSNRALSPSISINLGLYGSWQTYSEQVPFTFFTDRSSYGPEVGLSIRIPVTQNLWFRFNGQGGVVFLSREDPVDSGELDQGSQWSASLEGQFNLTQNLGLRIHLHYRNETLIFKGFGTRAQGIRNAQTMDYNLLSTLSGVWVL